MLSIHKSSKAPNKLYKNILISLTLSISLTIFSLSSFLYLSVEKISLKIIHTFIEDSLSQISYSSTFMRDLAKSLSLQIYFNDKISKLSYYLLDEREEYFAVDQAAEQLRSFRNTSPYIHSIYVYNFKKETLYTSLVNFEKIDTERKAAFFDQDIFRIAENMKEHKRLIPIPRKIPNAYPKYLNTTFTNVYTFLFYEAPEGTDIRDDQMIILNISEQWLRNMIDRLDIEPRSNTFIIDSKGTLGITDEQNSILTNVSNQRYIQDILSSQNESGYFISNVNGVKTLVTYISSDVLDWKFVRTTPYNFIVEKINNMKYRTFQIGLVILAIGLLTSYLVSRRLYSPIGSMFFKITSLLTEKKGIQKQSYLKDILQNTNSNLTETMIHKNFHEFNINIDSHRHFFIVLFKIDNFANFNNNHSVSEKKLKKFAMMNIAAEILSDSFLCESVEMDDDHVVLICQSSYLIPALAENINGCIQNIQDNVAKLYKLSLSAVVSSTINSFSETSYTYYETLNASNYRLIYGHKCIIYSDSIEDLNNKPYTYPSEKGRLLADALLLGKTEDAKSIYLEIVNSTASYSYTILKSVHLRLAVDINIVLDAIQRNSGSPMPYNLSLFITELDRLETLEDLNQHFFSLFESIVPKLKDRTHTKHEELINKVIELIHAQYMDANLSVDMIAGQVNMSSLYLGRLFKKVNSKSIAEYIIEVRIEKAKGLLLTTEDSIVEISEKTGFSNSGYFYTLFKKSGGVTPNQYRQAKLDES